MDFDRAMIADLFERLDHVAMAVPTVEAGLPMVSSLGGKYFAGLDQPQEGFRWVQFLLPDESKLELISPIRAGSFLDRFLEERGPGLHHITLKVTDVAEAAARAEAQGYRIIGPSLSPIWSEVFIHPSNPLGTLVQLAEWPSDDPWTKFSLDDVLSGRAIEPT
jgi:methylmalonyl-CoA/ethylmalonyl-CoA epimerase